MAAHYQSAPGPSRTYHSTAAFPSPSFRMPSPYGEQPQAAMSPPEWTTQAMPHGGSASNGLGVQLQDPGSYRAPSPSQGSHQTAPLRPNPSSTPSNDSRSKRNPLTDMLDTEKIYIEQLTLVIRRVAAAWSRKDLPPAKLDPMFRCVEAIYRANRSFASKLKDIATNPSDAKGLGDLLMRWVDDLEPAYGRYASIYLTGFDNYRPIVNNTLLPRILDEVTSLSPPTPPLQRWSLDALFLLPYGRLRYYRKLYTRLLKNTSEGRSDHRMLLTASQRLEALVNEVEARLECDVCDDDPSSSVGDLNKDTGSWTSNKDKERASRTSSALDSSVESQSAISAFVDSTHSSATSAATSINRSPGRVKSEGGGFTPLPPPVSDLELRIDTERTIDLFNMQPRKCRLQMNNTALPFTRKMLSSHNAVIHFTPTSTNDPVIHHRAHIFILTDLFLITDLMEAAEKAEKAQQVAREQPNRVGEGGPMPEMWLSYPPLAGKHLRVQEGEQSNVVAVTVMRKETFVIHAESEIERDLMMKNLAECADTATRATVRPTITTNQPISPISPINHPQSALSPISPGSQAMRFPNAMAGASSQDATSPSNLPGHLSQLTIGSGGSRWSQDQDHSAAGRGIPVPQSQTPNGQQRRPSYDQYHQQQQQHPQHSQPYSALPPRSASMPVPHGSDAPHPPNTTAPSGRAVSPMPQPGANMPQRGQIMPGQPHSPGQMLPGGQQVEPGQGMPGQAYGGHHGAARQLLPGHGHPNGPPANNMYDRSVSGPAGRSASVNSSNSATSRTSAQSAPQFPQGGMTFGQYNGVMPVPTRAAPAPPGGPIPGLNRDLPPQPGFGRTPTNYSDVGGYPGHLSHDPIPVRSHSAEPTMYDTAMPPPTAPPAMPSAHLKAIVQMESSSPRASTVAGHHPDDESPPPSPKEEYTELRGPTVITSQMKCKVFHKQSHAQWKSHGQGKLKLYAEKERPVKQLVVENSNGKGMLISTIVLADGVERVGRTGVAIELSDRGHRTGIIYMIQLRSESAALGLYKDLLAGTDRARTQ